MPENKSKILIPAVGTAVIAAGGIAAFMYFKSPIAENSDALSSAKIVPSQALMATYISTDDQAWAKLQQFGTPQAQNLVAKDLNNFNQNFFTKSNISYEKDLKPWVGGVMIAVLPSTSAKPVQLNLPSGTSTKVEERKILTVVGIKDKLSALNFANKLKGQKNFKSREIDYKGEKITEITDKGTPTYSAVLNDHVVFAAQKQAVEQAIDTVKGEPSFASKQEVKDILTKRVDVQNTLAQIYVPDYAGMVQELLTTNPQATTLAPQTLAQLKQVKSLVGGVGVDDAGVRMKAIAFLNPQPSQFQYQNTSAKIVSQVPNDAIAFVSGQGINRWWSTFVEQSQNTPEINQELEQIRLRLKALDIDLDKDIFGWMDGEYGFAIVPSKQGFLANFGAGGAFLLHTSDRNTAQTALTKIDNLAKKQLPISISQRNLAGKDLTEWQIPQQGALLTHGWLDQNTVFVAFGGSIAEAIATPGSQSLENSEAFKAVTSTLQKPNGGYFYLDMDKTMSLVNRFAIAQNQPLTPQAKAILSSIRGLGVTATSPDQYTTQMEMLLALKPKTSE